MPTTSSVFLSVVVAAADPKPFLQVKTIYWRDFNPTTMFPKTNEHRLVLVDTSLADQPTRLFPRLPGALLDCSNRADSPGRVATGFGATTTTSGD